MPKKRKSDEERLSWEASWADAARASEDKTTRRLTTYEMSMAGLGCGARELSRTLWMDVYLRETQWLRL